MFANTIFGLNFKKVRPSHAVEDNVELSSDSDDEVLAVHRRIPPESTPEVVSSEEAVPVPDREVLVEEAVPVPDREVLVEVGDNVDEESENAQVDDNTQVENENEIHSSDNPDEADDEDYDQSSSSDSESPRRQPSTRERKPTRVFTYDKDGNSVWQAYSGRIDECDPGTSDTVHGLCNLGSSGWD